MSKLRNWQAKYFNPGILRYDPQKHDPSELPDWMWREIFSRHKVLVKLLKEKHDDRLFAGLLEYDGCDCINTVLAQHSMSDPLKPSLTLLSKLGSIVVHTDEMLSPKCHPVDKAAIEQLLNDPEVKEWIDDMGVFLPVKR